MTPTMPQLPRIFERLAHAEQARAALIEAGFPADTVEVTARQDEAGPVEGNFLVGNVKKDTVEQTDFVRSAGGEGDNTYEHNFDKTVYRGVYMLTVLARGDAERRRAEEVLSRFPAVDVDKLVARRPQTSSS